MTEVIADHDELEQAGEFARIVVQGRTAIARARIGASILTVLAWSTVVAGAFAAVVVLVAADNADEQGVAAASVLVALGVIGGAAIAAGILFALAGLAGVSATRLDLAIFEALDYDVDA